MMLGKVGELAGAASRYAASLTRLRIISAQVAQLEARLLAHGTDDRSCDCQRCQNDRVALYGARGDTLPSG